MKIPIILSTIGLAHATIQGIALSRHEPYFNFTEAHSVGLQYAYIKATEGPTFVDPKFQEHFKAAADARFLRGATHVAHPSASSGTMQAQFFLANGGSWTKDLITLPGVLELGGECTDFSAQGMVAWIQEFGQTYGGATGRWPVLKADNNWWVQCTGNTNVFVSKTYLKIVHWGPSPGSVPGNWGYWAFWQYAKSGAWGGSSEVFNGDVEALRQFARGD